ncbi:MAG TPA: zinc ribbon domain-containing protein [Symbiobacteriaceae bacterium]|nr:zinc ribbon domain-containing protein [Symbiobacteriaceae bacterium]
MDRELECLRCKTPLQFLKEYRFDSQNANRGLLGSLFDVEEHLQFEVHVCPRCRHSEFFYTGSRMRLD